MVQFGEISKIINDLIRLIYLSFINYWDDKKIAVDNDMMIIEIYYNINSYIQNGYITNIELLEKYFIEQIFKNFKYDIENEVLDEMKYINDIPTLIKNKSLDNHCTFEQFRDHIVYPHIETAIKFFFKKTTFKLIGNFILNYINVMIDAKRLNTHDNLIKYTKDVYKNLYFKKV